jgi:hypothetical protein
MNRSRFSLGLIAGLLLAALLPLAALTTGARVANASPPPATSASSAPPSLVGDTPQPPADPHGAPPSGSATPKGFTAAVPCSACHTTTAWREKGASGDGAKFDHSTTGFPLTGQHIHASCTACHNSTRVLKRACVSCHEDFHRGRLSQSCDTCHTPAGWLVTRPLDIHRRTRFPLTGMHVLADCTECHLRASENRYINAPIDCFGCHEADYRRPGNQPSHVGTATSAPLPRDCSLCHRAVSWVPAALGGPLATQGSALGTQAPKNHDMRFPLSFGVHRTASCEDCHASPAAPRAVRCIGCHAHDPVTLQQQHKQPIPTDGPSCMACHPGGARR